MRLNPCSLQLVTETSATDKEIESQKMMNDRTDKEEAPTTDKDTHEEDSFVDNDKEEVPTTDKDTNEVENFMEENVSGSEDNVVTRQSVSNESEETDRSTQDISYELEGQNDTNHEQEALQHAGTSNDESRYLPLCVRKLQDYNAKGTKEDEEIQEIFLCVEEEKKLELEAKKEEIESLQKHNVFEEKDTTDVQQPLIGTRWVITDKSKNGITKKRARLVAKGFQEKQDNLRADSPTCLKETLRLVITIAAAKKWDVRTLAFQSAFLQRKEIERDIFLIPPPEIKSGGFGS